MVKNGDFLGSFVEMATEREGEGLPRGGRGSEQVGGVVGVVRWPCFASVVFGEERRSEGTTKTMARGGMVWQRRFVALRDEHSRARRSGKSSRSCHDVRCSEP